MNTLTRLLVGLDMTAMDETLIRYAALLSAELKVEEVSFIHIVKRLEMPEELQKGLLREQLSAGEGVRLMILEKVKPAFERLPHINTEVLVAEDSPLKGLLHWSKLKNADLLLVGRKLRLRGTGVLAQKILRTGRISVLFVPETAETRLHRVVVSLDFSKYSEMALERVLNYALAKPDVHVVCLHVYEVPSGYITLGMSYEVFEERMRGFAMQKYDQVLQRFPELRDRGELVLVRQAENYDIGEQVVMEAKRARADLLVVGAKGMSATALFVLGSVTEKVLRYDIDIPLLIFKNKDEKLGFVDALLSD
jgi:nucleotide-binding universal stress UspA family protein